MAVSAATTDRRDSVRMHTCTVPSSNGSTSMVRPLYNAVITVPLSNVCLKTHV